MLRADLEPAGIPEKDQAGREVLFHSLRHTLATNLDQTGASIAERAAIMRHSDKSNLTLGTYTHVQVHNLRQAIENLPDYPWPGSEQQRVVAAGTDGANVAPNRLGAKLGASERTTMDFAGRQGGNELHYSPAKKAIAVAKNGNYDVESQSIEKSGLVAQRQSSGLIIHWS